VDHWLRTLDLLSPDECATVHAWVHELRPYWDQRHPTLPFYTLGAVSHLDAVDNGTARYRAKAAAQNGLLYGRLEWVYQRLADMLARVLDTPFFYDQSLGLPGFHIFLDPAFSCAGAGKHFDLEHLLIDWDHYEDVDTARKLSLAVAIRLPQSGSGLWLWDINYLDMQKLSPEAVQETCRQKSQPILHAYALGRLVAHSGYQLHQIGASKEFQPGEERLTLQAHAQRVRQGYVLYW